MQQLRAKYDAAYMERFGQSSGKGFYGNLDWRRIEYATTLIPDDAQSVLDVGVGPGALLNYLGLCGKYPCVVGVDRREYTKFVSVADSVDLKFMNARKLEFEDRSFSVVTCLEVLEHLDTRTFVAALAELRRVAKDKLIMSVPFEEPEPLPSYHLQRFDKARLEETFPNAEINLLYAPRRRGTPWAMITEQPGAGPTG